MKIVRSFPEAVQETDPKLVVGTVSGPIYVLVQALSSLFQVCLHSSPKLITTSYGAPIHQSSSSNSYSKVYKATLPILSKALFSTVLTLEIVKSSTSSGAGRTRTESNKSLASIYGEFSWRVL